MDETLQFAPGGLLIEQGAKETHAFLIESGSVKIVMRDGSHEQILAIAGIGEAVGELALFEDAPRSASVIALEPTTVRRVTRSGLKELMKADPGICLTYLKAAFERLRTSNSMLLAAQQTQNLLQTTRVRLSLEPLTEEARRLTPQPAVIELDANAHERTVRTLLQGLEKHFRLTAETFFPEMQR